jgi:hypothetical protein
VAISLALNAPLVDATSMIVPMFFKSAMVKSLAGCAGAACVVACVVVDAGVSVAFGALTSVSFFTFFVAIFFLLIAIRIIL